MKRKTILLALIIMLFSIGLSTTTFSYRVRVIRRSRVTRVTLKTFRRGRFRVRVTYKRPSGRIGIRNFYLRRGMRKYFRARRGSLMIIRYRRIVRRGRIIRRYPVMRRRVRIAGRYRTINL